MKKLLCVAASAAALTAAPAFAGVAITGAVNGSPATYDAPAGSTKVIDFDSASLTTEAASKGFTATTTGTAVQVSGYQWDYEGTGNDFYAPEPTNNTQYFGVGRNSSLTLLGTVAQQSVSVFVGSLDAYNVVTLLDAAGNSLGSFTGTDMAGFTPPFPGTAATDTNRRITFSADAGSAIYGISFSNNDDLGSFELDNVAFTAAVPEPATWAMMLLGFGMVAGAARYRRRATNVRFA